MESINYFKDLFESISDHIKIVFLMSKTKKMLMFYTIVEFQKVILIFYLQS